MGIPVGNWKHLSPFRAVVRSSSYICMVMLSYKCMCFMLNVPRSIRRNQEDTSRPRWRRLLPCRRQSLEPLVPSHVLSVEEVPGLRSRLAASSQPSLHGSCAFSSQGDSNHSFSRSPRGFGRWRPPQDLRLPQIKGVALKGVAKAAAPATPLR